MAVAQDVIHFTDITSRYIYSELLMTVFSN